MSYSPPGTETKVTIDSTTVTLPGGTRVLSLIGNADRTKSTQGEAQIQPASRIVTVYNSGLNTVNNIYDYSGPSQSLRTYYPSASGANGDGYTVVGDTITWTVAASPYPTSTTPPIGNLYLVDYTYSGVATSESHTVSASMTSGTHNALTISDATVVTKVSGSGFVYPEYAEPNAGWYLSGNSIYWSMGASGTFAEAQDAGTVASGSKAIYVTYDYAGTKYSETLIQNATYTNALAIPTVLTILNVSGTSGHVYTASGITTTPDLSGYGTSGSGWSPSGNNIVWSPVNPAAYSYPYATVVPVNGQFYLDYTSNKVASDYDPKAFVAANRVVDTYGPVADWSLVTSGPNRGTYTLNKINPISLASTIAFQNNASLLLLTQIEGAGTTAGDFLDTLEKIQTRTVDVIVPLTVGSGLANADGNEVNGMSLSDRALALNYTKLHCETMSNATNKKERVAIGSMGRANVGSTDVADENSYIYTAQIGLNSKRIAVTAPGKATIQLADDAGTFHNVEIDGCFMSAAVASLSVSPLNDVATPLTNKEIIGFTDISAESDDHPSSEYLVTEMNNLAAAGVMVIAKEGPRIFVRHQLTTDQSNVINGEFSVVTLIDYVAQAVRFSCQSFIGQKLKPATTIPAVRGTILTTLSTLAQNDIISSIGGIVVQINPLNPTELLVEAAYVPIFPLNRIKVNFTIKTLG